jgi:hypothetical protein
LLRKIISNPEEFVSEAIPMKFRKLRVKDSSIKNKAKEISKEKTLCDTI